MRSAEVRRVRRWLWARLSVRRMVPDPPQEAERWRADSRLACIELWQVLADLTRTGKITLADAQGWAADAALDGQRRPKPVIAAALGLSVRGLNGRLEKVDASIGRTLARRKPLDKVADDAVDQVVAALTAEGHAVLLGDLDLADAFRKIAWERAGRGPRSFPNYRGKDRARRMRGRRQAEESVARMAQVSPVIPRLQSLRATSEPVVIHYGLCDDPAAAVAELERAWVDRAVEAYPVLIDNAFSRAPSLRSAGSFTRLRLLEIVANILRDTESLLALSVATLWYREAIAVLGPQNRQVISAARTRAHVLQLHGYLAAAASSLDYAMRILPRVPYESEHDRRMEAIDLLMRRAKVEVAYGKEADLNRMAQLLGHLSAAPEASSHPLPPRAQLHFLALRIEGERVPSLKLRGQYETAKDILFARIPSAHGAHPLAMLDTLITCALRVREGTRSVRHIVEEWLPTVGVDPAWSNQFDRMRQRLSEAHRHGIVDNLHLSVPRAPHVLRIDGTLPETAEYRV